MIDNDSFHFESLYFFPNSYRKPSLSVPWGTEKTTQGQDCCNIPEGYSE